MPASSRARTRSALALSGALVGALMLSSCGVIGGDADLQVYSARKYGSEEVFKEFTDETGISVEFIFDENAALLERIKAEGANSPADVYMTVDAGNLWNADQEGVLKPLNSRVLDEAVPEADRAADGTWYGLAKRARTVIYNPDAVDPSEFDAKDTYAGLGDPKWRGRICMRDTSEAYQVSLVASLMDLYGEDRAREIVESWVANDVEIMSNDVLLIEAVDAGTCDVAVVNHYYLARELADRDLNVDLYWASQEGAGTHVNLSGAGVVKTSDNPRQAQRLLEWLATDGQEAMIAGNHEFPVNPEVQPDEEAAQFGDFTEMPINAEAYGSLNSDAADLLTDAGWK
ncbi:extracellular solute-binding protein [Nocardioides rotundus]|uniref:extracellular solute-binding protein n=1 Tax=Nocardioides rotundus TaxID=1774216 RepID=UPI001CBCFEF0|nr:extracellular solute-binding protein [Nocardioides rotundus]UAL28511.1 extracellular solute-binding protein [Nocardioides rotundus]